MISLATVVWFVVYLLVAGCVFGLLKLIVDKNPWMPEAWKPTVNYILLVLAVLILIGLLISLIPGQGPIFRSPKEPNASDLR
jgi:hypothetical protein